MTNLACILFFFSKISISSVDMKRIDLWLESLCLSGKVGLLSATGRDTEHV